jgi:hypothetical protein
MNVRYWGGFPTKILFVFLIFTMRAICPSQFIFLELIALTILSGPNVVSCFVFGRYLVQISVQRPIILTELTLFVTCRCVLLIRYCIIPSNTLFIFLNIQCYIQISWVTCFGTFYAIIRLLFVLTVTCIHIYRPMDYQM